MSLSNVELFKVQGLAAQGMTQTVDFKVQAGQVWMVQGESGSGKSQLLKALADLIDHTGQAWLNGQAQSLTAPDVWRRQVMYFSAETAWWNDTVAAHFDTLPSDADLAALGLEASFLAKNPDSLSSGEKQRLALLRGASYHPSVLLLDEITANLDENTCLKVEAWLSQYVAQDQGQRALLWISHDSRQIQRMMTPHCLCRLEPKERSV
ncbi:ABC transporter ATP-binding protein [Thiomicrorhabdus aquaedulcis]|uniref:ABC transporter ATP-binding protein n=1 Tax=Thiomicrorhabdus aquaedulcis TaxID=2211106 RepID=UPI001E58725D|nr:ATP-binding cassette domain-containing protein [Thiomicrorhabdus aquaedulcis]